MATGLQIDPVLVLAGIAAFESGWAYDYFDTYLQMNMIAGAMYSANCLYGNDGSWPTFAASFSGTLNQQYGVGDYTGGQTVDFATGRGTGQSSVCGVNAKVAYIKVEAWDDTTGSWVTIAEGYSTTCG